VTRDNIVERSRESFNLTFTIPSSLDRVVPGKFPMAFGEIIDTTGSYFNNLYNNNNNVDVLPVTVSFNQPFYTIAENQRLLPALQLSHVIIDQDFFIVVQVYSSNMSAFGKCYYIHKQRGFTYKQYNLVPLFYYFVN